MSACIRRSRTLPGSRTFPTEIGSLRSPRSAQRERESFVTALRSLLPLSRVSCRERLLNFVYGFPLPGPKVLPAHASHAQKRLLEEPQLLLLRALLYQPVRVARCVSSLHCQ